jgi:hypothetical protein
MNHNEFNKKWIGKSYIEPWMDTVECVWWVKLYWKELWFNIGAFGWSAINGWNTFCPFGKEWKRVEYKPGIYPRQWDILFWSENRCKFGHTAFANKFCNANVLRYTDQNGTGKRDPFTARFTDYKHLLWWATRY